ncbi:MAG: T9SS type A sorting domain-containing protein [Saprospiraceae bacterium]|nr:T9SS type A sorting domain-containing protein [Saprospiraceae bacterium]
MKKSTLLALVLPLVVAALAFFPVQNKDHSFHTRAELDYFEQMAAGENPLLRLAGAHGSLNNLLIDSNILFPTSRTCSGCHGHDPNMIAFITSSGEDVNIYDDWRSTMMANSAKDPFWRAKVSHEILINPAHSLALQDKCTSCHAPAGHYQAKLHDNKQYYLLSDLYADTLGQDGVTCQVCHAQAPDKLGSLHSGELYFDTNHIRVAYGPYKFAFAPPMHNFVGITPLFGEHIGDAGLCAGCHTLITGTVDLQGNATGDYFVEQATYHEWLNSRYDKDNDNISCQSCHMQQIEDPVIISANYQFLFAKFPFGLHELAGANVTMLKLMKENRVQLGIDAEAENFDSTIAATLRMLQQKTLNLKLETGDLTGDSMNFTLKLQNMAGHKFPSGYPSRRAWVEFEVKDETGQTVFHSGKMNPDFTLADEDLNMEPHYNVISSPQQVQIYEMVPGDVNGNFTNVLERGYRAIKDNRLTPQGFRSDDVVYDTTAVVGVVGDNDFNLFPNGTEGSGADVLHFRLPNNGYTGYLSVSARVWYQSLPPKWMAPLFEYSSPEIDSFKAMFDAADRSPVLVAAQQLDSVYVSSVATKNLSIQGRVQVFPSLSTDGKVWVKAEGNVAVRRIQIWDAAGRLLFEQPRPGGEPVSLPNERGMYFVVVETSKGKTVQKVVRQ